MALVSSSMREEGSASEVLCVEIGGRGDGEEG